MLRRVDVSWGWVGVVAAGVAVAVAVAPGLAVFLGVLSVLVAVHEGAHLVAAVAVGMRCTEYAVGFGPSMFSVRVRGVRVGVRAVPAGGFVRILGMGRSEPVAPELEPVTFRAGPLWARLLVLLAGPVSNLVFAVITATVVFGPMAGATWASGLGEAVRWIGELVGLVVDGYRDLVADLGSYPAAVLNPDTVEVTRVMSPVEGSRLGLMVWDAGWPMVLLFTALVSVSLGVFNLLPLLPLDGGHVAVAVVEAAGSRVLGRPVVVPARAAAAMSWGLVGLLMGIAAVGVWLDVAAPVTVF